MRFCRFLSQPHGRCQLTNWSVYGMDAQHAHHPWLAQLSHSPGTATEVGNGQDAEPGYLGSKKKDGDSG